MKHPSQEDLLGYMLGALDGHEHEQIQQRIDQDPTLEEKLLAIKAALSPLESLDSPAGPPPGLARRCCQFVASASRKVPLVESADSIHLTGDYVGSTGSATSRLPFPSAAATVAGYSMPGQQIAAKEFRPAPACFSTDCREKSGLRPGWSMTDFVFAGAAALVVAAILLPGLSAARFNSRVAQCQDNLRSVFNSLSVYAESHSGKFPEIPQAGPLATPGCLGPILKEAGLVPDDALFACPGLGTTQPPIPKRIPTATEVRSTTCEEQLYWMRQRMLGNYGYSLGYLKEGKYCGPAQSSTNNLVLMTDAPHVSTPARISRNHDGRGQNCLMSDGSILFNRNGFLGTDAIFVNDQNLVAPGTSPFDMVVGPGHLQLAPRSAAIQ